MAATITKPKPKGINAYAAALGVDRGIFWLGLVLAYLILLSIIGM